MKTKNIFIEGDNLDALKLLQHTYLSKIKMIYIEVPYKKLMQQNHNRDYKVPENVIEKMIHKLEIPTYGESHELIF